MKWRLLGALVGLGYAAFSGFLALASTGGGHGTMMFLMVFAVPNLCGLYYPMMGWMAVGLDSPRKRMIFGSLLAVNVIISTFIFVSGFWEDPYAARVWRSNPQEVILFTASFAIPSVLFAGILLNSIMRRP